MSIPSCSPTVRGACRAHRARRWLLLARAAATLSVLGTLAASRPAEAGPTDDLDRAPLSLSTPAFCVTHTKA